MAAPMTALPPAYRDRARSTNPLVVVTGIWASSAIVAFGTLVAAFTQLRAGKAGFFPADYAKKNYMPTMLVVASVLLIPMAEWLVWSVRKNERRQAAQAVGVTVFLLLAMLNGLFYSVRIVEYGADSSTFGVFFYAFYALSGASIIAALVAAAIFTSRLATRQVSALEPLLARATSIVVHVAALGWVCVWATLYAASK